jgi:meiotic recombination protein SPO11
MIDNLAGDLPIAFVFSILDFCQLRRSCPDCTLGIVSVSLHDLILLLQAKGYPDLSTRIFLSFLTSRSPHIPTYAIVDYDPDGLAILSTYKHGSYALAHENSLTTSGSAEGQSLNLPQLRWIGVKSHHLKTPVSTNNGYAERDVRQTQGLMKLTRRDRCKARRMLEWEVFAEDGIEIEWRNELQIMLMLNVKAEMQIFEERDGGLALWLKGELGRTTKRGFP